MKTDIFVNFIIIYHAYIYFCSLFLRQNDKFLNQQDWIYLKASIDCLLRKCKNKY